MTTWTEFATVFRTRFATEFATPQALDFVIENQDEDDADGVPLFQSDDEWCRVVIRQGDSKQTSCGAPGSRNFRTVGVAMVQIHVPLGGGDGRARALADSLKTAFQGVTVSGVIFKMPSLKGMGRQAQWWQVTVSIPFQFDEMA